MKRRANPTLIGAFVLGALALVIAALSAVAGGRLFERKQRAVMHFQDSIYGLEVGAPVVFRGVRVGSVAAIGVYYDRQRDDFAIPVAADLDGNAIRGLDGKRAGAEAALPALVERGLRARLAMQSLLTGQLYVDLDLRPGQPSALHGTRSDAVEIPTSTNTIQNLKSQLDGIDLRRLVDDVSAAAAAARGVMAGPQLKQAMDDLQQITGNLKRLSARAEQRFEPLAGRAIAALDGTAGAMDKVGAAADGVRTTARSADGAARHLDALLAPDSPLVQDLRSSADQLARTAAALRRGTAEDSALMQNTQRALQDVSRTSRALRELVEMLDRHPQALLRGRATPNGSPGRAGAPEGERRGPGDPDPGLTQ